MKKSHLVKIITEQVDFIALEKKLDDMFEELGMDVNFTRHFKERVLERNLTEEDILELAKKIIDKYPDDVADLRINNNVVVCLFFCTHSSIINPS